MTEGTDREHGAERDRAELARLGDAQQLLGQFAIRPAPRFQAFTAAA